MKNTEYVLMAAVLNLFDGNTNVTTDAGLSVENKTWFTDYLIDMAEPELVHGQVSQKRQVPKNNGKTVEFRKYSSLPKMLVPLTEGVTPNGQKLNVSNITVEVRQYGGYIELSDILILTAIDNNLVQATRLLASQMGRTLDTITREVLSAGTNVQYAEGQVSSRSELVGGAESGNHYLTVDAIRRAVRTLKVMNAPKCRGGYYFGIIHPDCEYDLKNDPKWENVKTYSDPDDIYTGEIGRIEGVRFAESSEAKIFAAEKLASDSQTLTVNGAANSTNTVTFDGGTVAAGALVGRKVLIGSTVASVTANTTTTITLDKAVTAADNAVIYPGEGGKDGRDVYSTLIIGGDAYGELELSGGGAEHIVKQLGSGGTADPLNQRATCGWKATSAAVRLVEEYIVRIETTSTYNDHIAN